MDKPISFFIGLDVHKDSIAIAVTKAQSREEPRFLGTTGYSVYQIEKALAHLDCAPKTLAIAYEAGPCGYGLFRELQAKGYPCAVVAPSKVPRRPADRIKTDRRDALLLARLHRSAELVAVTVPDAADEAVRDLMRARDDAVKAQKSARQQLMAFLLRLGQTLSRRPWLDPQAFALSGRPHFRGPSSPDRLIALHAELSDLGV